MRKKIVALLLCTVICAGFMSGCSKETASTGDVKVIKIWSSVGHSKGFWNEKIQEFNDTIGKKNGIKLEVEFQIDGSYNQMLDVAIQSDDLPDIFDGGATKQLVELDRIVPIDDLPGCDKLIEKYDGFMQEGKHKYQGKSYALPGGATTRGLIYNKDMFKAAGIVDEKGEAKPPVTLAEYREYAKKLTDKSKNQFGIVLPLKWVSWVKSDITSLANGSFGISCYDPVEQKYDYTILKPIIDTYLGMKEDGSVYPGELSLDNDPARARFAEGGIGMKIAYSFDLGVLTTQFPAKFDWGVAPLPVLDAENTYKQYSQGSLGMRVSKKAIEKHGKEAVGLVYSWWYGDDNARDLYERGLEIPVVWEVVEDIELPEEMANWKAFCEMQAISQYDPLTVPTDLSGKTSLNDRIINNIWCNGADVMAELQAITDDSNAGIELYKKNHPDADYSIYEYKEWNAKR